ncbi:sodium:calcium antiporter [Chlamydiia bacterium]|jgi:cation:H+ antiporter|nr:sodium:calcium antiporter [Chlamydiia bacterium]
MNYQCSTLETKCKTHVSLDHHTTLKLAYAFIYLHLNTRFGIYKKTVTIMSIAITLLIIFVCSLVIYISSSYFVDGCLVLSQQFNLSHMFVGSTLLAIGTSMPELITSLVSWHSLGSSAFVWGNIYGSNNANIMLIMSFIIITTPTIKWRMTSSIRFFCVLVAFYATLGFFFPTLFQYAFIGLFMILCYIVYLYVSKDGLPKKESEGNLPNISNRAIPKSYYLLPVSFLTLTASCYIFMKQVDVFAQLMNISQQFLGVSVVSLSTSFPELITSLHAVRKGAGEMILGNIIGSNMFNLFLVGGYMCMLGAGVNQEMLYNADLYFQCLTVCSVIAILSRVVYVRYIGITNFALYLLYNYVIYVNN